MKCSVEGCDHAARGNGNLCNMHRLRQQRHGRLERDPTWIRGIHCERGRAMKQCPAAKRIWGRMDYAKNPDTYRWKAAQWHIQNLERKRELLAREDSREKARARTKKWSAENRDRKRATDRAFVEKNRHLAHSYQARRRARVKQAVPAWITDETVAAIQAIYAEAARASAETGIEHEVDHIVPLAGKIVCGLHVPWNLRVIPAIDNNRRPRIWSEGESP